MKVLVIGQGGREHALIKALSSDVSRENLHALPGSEGISDQATCHPDLSVRSPQVIEFCRSEGIDLIVVGPEQPLVDGLYDDLKSEGFPVMGCSQAAARLEGSKIFSKEFMNRAGVPTSKAKVVASVADLKACVHEFSPPYVLKADGLAAGKGVFIADTSEELFEAGRKIFEERILGTSGERALLEQFQPGYELSVFVLTNGKDFQILPLAQDHKRLLDGQRGPNTGGMGTVAPISTPAEVMSQIEEKVVAPSVAQLNRDGLEYRGVLFIGLMITPDGPSVLEYNVRFGDPETQVLLPLLDGSWLDVFSHLAKGELVPLKFRNVFATCVVLAAEGYPDTPKKDVPIYLEYKSVDNAYFLHAGTAKKDGQWVTNGGRVLNAVAIASTREEAVRKAYELADAAQWPGRQLRTDIGR